MPSEQTRARAIYGTCAAAAARALGVGDTVDLSAVLLNLLVNSLHLARERGQAIDLLGLAAEAVRLYHREAELADP